MKKLFQRRKGFTLIELLIVIVIIGILAVGFAPTLLNAPKKARDAMRKGQIASIRQAIEAYALDSSTGGYPTTDTTLVCLTSTTGGVVTPSATATAIKQYFQGSVLPKDPSYTGDTPDTCGFSYKYIAPAGNPPTGGCYIISVKLEDTGKGNSSAGTNAAALCGVALADNSGNYYQTIVKF